MRLRSRVSRAPTRSRARLPRRLVRRRALSVAAAVATVASTMTIGTAGQAFADPSANDWYRLRMCESSNRYDIDTGNGYYGAYQFDLSTWKSVGGTGLPSDASKTEQDYRALILYRMRGWQPWGCARLVGLKEDSDAASGVMPPKPGTDTGGGSDDASSGGSSGDSGSGDSGSGDSGTAGDSGKPDSDAPDSDNSDKQDSDAGDSTPPSGEDAAPAAPDWPGRQYFAGDYSAQLKVWQKQAHALGYDLVGTGYFGPKTKQAVLAIQKQAGLNVVGFIGPKTWRAAWQLAAGS